jgi:hypothetical protein
MKFNKTGFIVTSILIAIGADLWYARSDFQPQPQDFSELMNAVQERCLASRFSTNSGNQPIIVSNGQYSVIKGGDDVHFFFNGTNPIPYSIPVPLAVAPYTNRTQVGSGDLSFSAIALDKTYLENDPTNRWILGTYASFTVSGFPEADFNGVYKRHYDAEFYEGQWYVYNVGYSNAAGCMMSPGEAETTFENDGGWWDGSYYSMQFPPWFGMAVSDSSGGHDPYADFYITCERGPLATNVFVQTVGTNSVTITVPEKITDRPCYTKTYVYDWVLDNRKPRWGDFFGVIDLVLWGGYNSGPGYPSSRYAPSGSGVWYPGFIYYSNSPSIYNRGQHFLNPAKWGESSFGSISDLYFSVSTWGLTNTVNSTNGANIQTFYGFDDSIIVPMGFNLWTDFRVSPSADQFNKHAFDQRREALQKCTVLRMRAGTAQWVHPYTNNVRSGSASSTNGYADACAQAKAACTNYSTADGPPYSYSYVQRTDTPTAYYVTMQSRDAKLQIFLDTNTQCEVSAYLKAGKPTYSQYYTNCFDNDSNVSFTTNIFTKIDSVGMGTHTSYEKTIVNGNNTFPPAPVVSGTPGMRVSGYTILDQEILTKWNFQYCQPEEE